MNTMNWETSSNPSPFFNSTSEERTTTNITTSGGYEEEFRPLWVVVLSSIILTAIIVVTVFGNAAVIFAIMTNRQLRDQPSSLFLVNLSITDFSNALFIMLSALIAVAADMREVNETWCDMMCALNYCFIIVSMMTLGFISVDRFLAVKFPFRYYVMMTRNKILTSILFSWGQGLVFGLTPALMNWVHFDYWEGICAINWHLEPRTGPINYVITAFILCFMLPGLTMLLSYSMTIRQAKRSLQTVYPQAESTAGNCVGRHGKNRSIKTIISLVVVVVFFFICMTPFSVTKLLKVLTNDPYYVPPYVNLGSAFFGYLASMVNPFIYGIFRRDFREAYRHFLYRVSLGRFGTSNYSTGENQSDVQKLQSKGKDQVLSVCNVADQALESVRECPTTDAPPSHEPDTVRRTPESEQEPSTALPMLPGMVWRRTSILESIESSTSIVQLIDGIGKSTPLDGGRTSIGMGGRFLRPLPLTNYGTMACTKPDGAIHISES